MLDLNSLTGVTKGNILGNISLHYVPLIGCFEILIHLIPSWMNGISGLMSLSKYLILQLLDIRHINPSLVSQHTLVIFCKSGRLLFLNIAFDISDILIF
jgi:hypothetical protein